MGRDKLQRGAQVDKIVQYTIPGQGSGDRRTEDPPNMEERPQTQDTHEILEVMQGTRVALEAKMDTMAMDINHLRLDLRKVAVRVMSTEGEIDELQNKICTLQATIETLQSEATRMAILVEDAEG
ncbi:hypothetical protein NDU88_005060 [Pleurodeles waltl]|uniref:Uncharacterized protein n=1 Tax=Pleurodeles waltl TaxID=8319 RepID=A0AAV7V4V2_PLEWA|nr:hypothetical protein NDU88_005060 [Pleurodeles waltl]